MHFQAKAKIRLLQYMGAFCSSVTMGKGLGGISMEAERTNAMVTVTTQVFLGTDF